MPSTRSKPTTKTTNDLSVLVNANRIRSSIRRLFHNNIAEVLSELFQNCQRSGAKNVEIAITPDGFSVTDDGHGLLGGNDGFHTLLKLAESAFDNPTVADQDPMGVGIVSLMTHDKVEEITFSSGRLQLTVDAAKWWTDKDYYSTWFKRVRRVSKAVPGLSIYVRSKAELITELRKTLEPKDSTGIFSSGSVFENASPAQGYAGILDITLDGKPVRTTLPAWTRFQDTLITTTYKGSNLTIGYAPGSVNRKSSLRWYGQLILVKTPYTHFHFHLDVQSGRPVNPLSPTRAGLIEDSAYHELLAFVKDQVFEFVLNPANRSKIKPVWVEECFRLDEKRALTESPYIVTESILPLANPSSFDDCDQIGKPQIFTYEEAPTLLKDTVVVLQKGQIQQAEYGLSSFVPLLRGPYKLRYGDRGRLRIGQLWWKPGKKSRAPWFFKPGEFGISFTKDQKPKRWRAVNQTPVFTFNHTGSYSVEEVDFTVGTLDPMSFLKNQVWCGFCPSDDYDPEPQEANFRESVDNVIRALIGRCVPRSFELYDLTKFLKNQNTLVTQIAYHYPKGTFSRNAHVSRPKALPSAITLHSSDKRSVRLKLY